MSRTWTALGLGLALAVGVSNNADAALTIDFNYSKDTNGFFTNNPAAKATLNAAGAFYSSILGDHLSAITSSGVNHFNTSFTDPTTGSTDTVNDFSVADNELVVYVGARSLGGTLGLGGPGGYSASGTSTFVDSIARGQGDVQGSTATDFAPWGGAVTVDPTVNWNYDYTVAPSSSQNDLYSVLLHELGHVLGIGTADSWNNLVSGGNFTGPASEAAYGGPVPLNPGLDHWAEGTMSTVYGTSIPQEAEMDPTLLQGTRKLVTTLDVAGLKDVGWQITAVPEPSALALCSLGLAGMAAFARHKKSRAA